MGRIIYKKGNLFEAPKEVLLVHACNAQGVWGGYKGIAGQFKDRFPRSFEEYKAFCHSYPITVGKAGVSVNRRVGWLITSHGYGRYRDSPEEIINQTCDAIYDLFRHCARLGIYTICSPKLNSGLFKVPWSDTEKIIEYCLEQHKKFTWTVYVLDNII